MDDARGAMEELGLEQKSLAEARADAESERNALDATRQEITDATAKQEALLAQSNGKIKSLVDEIQAQKEREQEAAARAAMERAAQQLAEQQAEARAAQQQSSASSGSSDNSASSGSDGSTPTEP